MGMQSQGSSGRSTGGGGGRQQLGLGGRLSNSSIYKMAQSENSTTVSSQYANLPNMDKGKSHKLVALDEEELANKLAVLRNGRKRKSGQMQLQQQAKRKCISPQWTRE